jgi:Hydrogenase maturation factor
VFPTTSAGRLFDAAAALIGFTRPIPYEGQAAIWTAQLARTAPPVERIRCPSITASSTGGRCSPPSRKTAAGGAPPARWRAHSMAGSRRAWPAAAASLCGALRLDAVVASGGVFQNQLLLEELASRLDRTARALDQPRGSRQRRRRQPGTGRPRRPRTMHELSIALSLVDLAEEEAGRQGGRVCTVYLGSGRWRAS